ncbi:MAG: TonB-dependent receptor plug domain-containing protein [Hyphomonadaceae bacterium]
MAALAPMPSVAQTAAPPQEAAPAQDASPGRDIVVVTANRREQDVTEIPYNITAVSSDAVERTGVASIEDLSRQIPNLVVTSSGAQFMGAQRQIMRGLNASSSNRNGVAIEQNPVSTYLGNAPYANFFQVDDVERVEVLRGPQGTLYGAGALGGAIRLIPTQPELGAFEGKVSGKAGVLEHSSDMDYGASALVNLPIGDTLALRVSGGYEKSAGYIDQFGIWVRQGDSTLGDPILANPGAPVTSPALSYNNKDVNWSKSTNWRAALRWHPTDAFDATLSHNIQRTNGFGPSFDTPAYNGGPDPFTPSAVYPDTGEYEVVMRGRQPFNRTSEMTTLDMSYDLGFATVSSTTSHFDTSGKAYYDGTWSTLALPAAYLPYYTGSPTNPRFNSIQRFDDDNEATTQEIRLVSNGDNLFDYIVGAFYTKEDNQTVWNGFDPGQNFYNGLPGVSSPGGMLPGPYETLWYVGGSNKFTDKAVFGELTWHVTPDVDLTVGARAFKQSLDREAFSINPAFGLNEFGHQLLRFLGHEV